jgi:carbon storage regulator CsrA
MLVLSREKNQSLVINGDIEVFVVEIRGDVVRLGVEAPPGTLVQRREVHEAISRSENDMRSSPDVSAADRDKGSRTSATLPDFQQLIRDMYFEKDAARGIDGTFMWLMEEVGELAAALRSGTHEERLEEFADVLAWLATIANVAGVDLGEAVARKYGSGCPGCGKFLCQCADAEKP